MKSKKWKPLLDNVFRSNFPIYQKIKCYLYIRVELMDVENSYYLIDKTKDSTRERKSQGYY